MTSVCGWYRFNQRRDSIGSVWQARWRFTPWCPQINRCALGPQLTACSVDVNTAGAAESCVDSPVPELAGEFPDPEGG